MIYFGKKVGRFGKKWGRLVKSEGVLVKSGGVLVGGRFGSGGVLTCYRFFAFLWHAYIKLTDPKSRLDPK